MKKKLNSEYVSFWTGKLKHPGEGTIRRTHFRGGMITVQGVWTVLYCSLHTSAAVADRLLTGTAAGTRGDWQRCRARHRFRMLTDGRDGRGLRVNAVWTRKVWTTCWKRTLPVRKPNGHLTAVVKTCQRREKTERQTDNQNNLNTPKPPASAMRTSDILCSSL